MKTNTMTTKDKVTPAEQAMELVAVTSNGETRLSPKWGQYRLATLKSQGHEAIGQRLADTWNACAGLPDPAIVPELVEALKQALVVMESVAKTHDYDISIGTVPQARALLARIAQKARP